MSENDVLLPVTKRLKTGDTGSMTISVPTNIQSNNLRRINSAIFQSLLFDETQDSITKALAFAVTNNMCIDNSKLYGASEKNKNKSLLVSWAKMQTCSAFSETQVRGLFNILLATGAHRTPKRPNLYDVLAETNTSFHVFLSCLLSRSDIFPSYQAMNYFAKSMWYKEDFFSKSVESALATSCPYSTFNRISPKLKFLNPLNSVVSLGCNKRLKILLLLIPIVDLDVFHVDRKNECECPISCKIHRWFSVEEWLTKAHNKDSATHAMIREARAILEEYRENRSHIVLQELRDSVFPASLCTIINGYGDSPQTTFLH